MGYVGPNGSGKSLLMVHDTIPSLRAGRTVLSTVHLLDYALDDPHGSHRHLGHNCNVSAHHPAFVALDRMARLMAVSSADVLLDEITGVASSRESMGLPPAVANLLVQLRRRDVVVRWTAPSWERADKILREVSQAVTITQRLGKRKVTSETGQLMWQQARMIRARTFDPLDLAVLDSAVDSRRKSARPFVKDRLRVASLEAGRAYDSLYPVEQPAMTTDSGSCLNCGGSRPRVKCSCEDHSGRPDPPRVSSSPRR